jgi:hypothetical protein
MADAVGMLRKGLSGRWEIALRGGEAVEITSGEMFRVEVEGKEGLQRTRMEYRHRDSNGGVVIG